MKKQFDLIDKKNFVKIHDIYYQCEGRQHFLKNICYYYYIVLFAGILKKAKRKILMNCIWETKMHILQRVRIFIFPPLFLNTLHLHFAFIY